MIVSKHFILLTLVLAPVIGEIFITEEDKIRGMDRNCPTVRHHVAKYHQDTACDRAAQNQYKPTLDRADVRVRLQHTGTRNVPDVKTSFCPQEAHPLVTPDHTTGFDTAWIVENTATTPVVISYVMQQEDGSFTEVSPFDTKSLAPTNQDPRNFLKPGEWKALQTHEGHVYHVREILKDGSMGQVLLQHRVGYLPVTNKYGHELDCNPLDPDHEPVIVKKDGATVKDPNYGRQPAKPFRPCNVIDIGFRNEVGCPINAYYTGTYALKGIAKPRGNATELAHTAKSCHEVFQFHLGLREKAHNFMMDWNSKTKFESTYIGHHYVFRYARDERIVVDSMSLQPTKVVDCPGLKNQIMALGISQAEAISTKIGRQDYFILPHSSMVVKNLNSTVDRNAYVNATLPPLRNPAQQVPPPILVHS